VLFIQVQCVWMYVKVKVKLSLYFSRVPRHEGLLGKWRYSSIHSLTSALDGCEWSASCPGRFTPVERVPGTHWIGGWVGPRAVLDAVVKRKIPRICTCMYVCMYVCMYLYIYIRFLTACV
jgi:hypothetical protein